MALPHFYEYNRPMTTGCGQDFKSDGLLNFSLKKVTHIEARERSFEEMKDYIKEKLHQQLVMFKVQQFIRQATERAGMQVYADRILSK